jgi:hypothetical protein
MVSRLYTHYININIYYLCNINTIILSYLMQVKFLIIGFYNKSIYYKWHNFWHR